MGDLGEAGGHAHEARKIRERLGLKELFRDYHTLADIARAQGDAGEAAEWERRRDAAIQALERRAGGPGGPTPRTLQAIQQLAGACARAAVDRGDLDPAAEVALAQLEQLPPPLPDLAAFLRRVAAGEQAAVPPGLPPELQQFLEQLLTAVGEARG